MPTFAEARAFLLDNRSDYAKAYSQFRWPDPVAFNWALDWFDGVLASDPKTRDQCALWIADAVTGRDAKSSFLELSRRSNETANLLRALGLRRGDRILMVLGNTEELWEVMLASIKLGTVLIPTTTLASSEELADRVKRGRARCIVTAADQSEKFAKLALDGVTKICIGGGSGIGWIDYADARKELPDFAPDGPTNPGDPMLLYFTSGTTAAPKLVLHTQRSYPVGALSTMYWLGLKPRDVHVNVSSPGWAKHAWSSFFAPWNAGATVLMVNQARFEAKVLLKELVRCEATTLCAPPTVWRLLAQEPLSDYPVRLREVCAAGEPLNPEMIERVQRAWGIIIRDGYGQTETTALVANSPGQPVKPGAMGRAMPGYKIRLLDADSQTAREGEVCVILDEGKPAGLMVGYETEAGLRAVEGEKYGTSDVAFGDEDGYLTFVGRTDDVFKSSDYRISPFELESVLIEHDSILESAIVPSPDPMRLALPKAFILLKSGVAPTRAVALSIFQHTNARLAPFKRIRKIEFVSELPKTISGKIQRVQLRRMEQQHPAEAPPSAVQFAESDFEELRKA